MPGVSYSETQTARELTQRLASYENFSQFLEQDVSGRDLFMAALGAAVEEQELDLTQRRLFADSLTVTPPDPDKESQLTALTLVYGEQLAGPDLLNAYFSWTDQHYRQRLVDRAQRAVELAIEKNHAQMQAFLEAYQEDIEARVVRMQETDSVKLAKLHDQLDAEKQSIVAAREERVRVLHRAEQIAAQLGITRPTTPRDLGRQNVEREVIYAGINSQQGLPLYFMGTEALRAEREVVEANLREEAKTPDIRNIEMQISQLQHNRDIEALQNREQDSPFIEEYNALQQENTLLRANLINADEIEIAEVTQWAYEPSGPSEPRKALILALSLVLGGMLGVMLVFLARFAGSLRSYRKIRQS